MDQQAQINALVREVADLRKQLSALSRLELAQAARAVSYSGTPTTGQVTQWAGAGTIENTGYAGSAVARYSGAPSAGRATGWTAAGTIADAGFGTASIVRYSGTPSAGQIAYWTANGTVTNADFGTANITRYSGTPSAGDVTGWAGNGTVTTAGFGTATIVRTSGDQTIAGVKTFSGTVDVTTVRAVDSNGITFKDDSGTSSLLVQDGGIVYALLKLMVGSTETPAQDFEVRSDAGGMTLTRTQDGEAFEPFVNFRKGASPASISQIRGLHGGGLRFTSGGGTTEWARFDANGNFGVGITPTTKLGVQAGSSTNDAAVGGVLYVAATTFGNVGTGEDTLATYSVPGNTLNTIGQSLWVEASGLCENNTNAKTLRFKFGSTTLFTFDFTVSAAHTWSLRARGFRTSSTATRWLTTLTTYNSSTGSDASKVSAAFTSEALSSARVLTITGEATTTDDIELLTFIVGWDDVNS